MVFWHTATGFPWNKKFKLSNGTVCSCPSLAAPVSFLLVGLTCSKSLSCPQAVKYADHTTDRRRCSFHICSTVTVGTAYVLFLIGCVLVAADYKVTIPGWATISSTIQRTTSDKCKDQGKPPGSEPLPKDIVSQTSNLEMQPLFGPIIEKKGTTNTSKNLLAMAVGIKQKEIVDQIVRKFISSDFTVMLFHYDGIMDEWKHFQWCDSALHVSAINQAKWYTIFICVYLNRWFSRRFLHPDIVAEYSYIFLWDEDLGVENFDPRRYLQIIQEEELEISQPALNTANRISVHYDFTARQEGSKVHRRVTNPTGVNRCHENITGPPCAGYVEMMAPVFSRAAWRCTWYMIQDDLISGWGMDFKFGYCAQGERTKKIGIVDAEYIEHKAVPSFGRSNIQKASSASSSHNGDRENVKKRSFTEWRMFENRWKGATQTDECWIDPYAEKIK
ncbi:hypothetical protein Taro_052530 [Colocasia esculenta]|uniref:Uncharacterized protein n=1 Tax=Colocasia esculenta TaxID=4460 RepID=A0A843XIV3_COLES|nr:hypothetical protein [Colocasia esculenta]